MMRMETANNSAAVLNLDVQQDLDSKEAPTKDEKMISSSGVRKKFNEDSFIARYTGGYLL